MQRFRPSKKQVRLFAVPIAAVALIAVGVVIGEARHSGLTASPDPTSRPVAGISSEPKATTSAAEVAQPLAGLGPFVLYATKDDEQFHLRAVNLGAPEPILLNLGRLAAAPHDWVTSNGGGAGIALVLEDRSIVVVRRGAQLRRIDAGEDVVAVAISPDAKRIAVARRTPGLEVLLYQTANSTRPNRLASFGTASDENGGEFELSWDVPDSITVVDSCHCDGGEGYTRLSRLSVKTGRLEEAVFLRDHDPAGMGSQLNGSLISFDDTPPVDCTDEPSPCENLLHTLTVADLEKHSMQKLASRRIEAFGSPQISPDGTLVASRGPQRAMLQVYDVRERRLVVETQQETANLSPAAWLNSNKLIAEAVSPDHTQERYTGQLVLIQLKPGEKYVEPRPLASGVNLRYVGWIR